MRALARKGAIEMIPGASRGIRLPESEADSSDGTTARDRPRRRWRTSPGVENVEDHCRIDPDFFQPRADYLLRVQGESMRDIGIMDGDLLAVHRTSEARNGQIVVARIGEEVTVKRFQKQGRKVSLIAENPDFKPIEVDLTEQELTIEGLSVGVIRR
ncbi:transcriptional repressor LexA [Halopseudomonas pachastrellae]|nr:transcriptional repressor LexA [Halopseudomonas pachastrellae]